MGIGETSSATRAQRTEFSGAGRMGYLGLFKPSAREMDEVYEPPDLDQARTYADTPMDEDLFQFNSRPYRRRDAANVQKYFTDGMLMTVAGGLFNKLAAHVPYPKWAVAMHNVSQKDRYIPYTRGGYLADAWRKKRIPNWAWLAGNFYK